MWKLSFEWHRLTQAFTNTVHLPGQARSFLCSAAQDSPFPRSQHKNRLPASTLRPWLLFLFVACFQLMTGAQASLVPIPATVYDNDVAGGPAGAQRRLAVFNKSADAVVINAIALAGTHTDQFQLGNLPGLPHTIAPGDSLVLSVGFAPSSTGLKTAFIQFTSAANTSLLSLPLRGLGTAGVGGTNEPSLQALFNLLELQVSAGDDNPATNIINSNSALQKAQQLGDELPLQEFRKAGPGLVTLEPLSVFGPTANNPVVRAGWYGSGKRNSRRELFSVSNNPATNAQTVQVAYNGTLQFDPGDTAFGFYSQWPFFQNRLLYSEDSLNSFSGSIPHHVRVYPYKKGGTRVPDTYIVAFEEHVSGFDFQDLVFIVRNVRPASSNITTRIAPKGDAFVNLGSANTNYGMDTLLQVLGSGGAGTGRNAYLNFPLQSLYDIQSATLRLYGRNKTSNQAVDVRVKALANANWSENTITANNAPAAPDTALATISVNGQAKYYDIDVTAFVRAQFARGKEADFQLTDTSTLRQLVAFNSKEYGLAAPQLIVATSAVAPVANATLFIENLDRFPSNDRFVASRLQTPTSRDGQTFNSNHDTARVRIHNKGITPLVVKGVSLSSPTNWKFLKLSGTDFDTTAFPLTVNPGGFTDLTLQFILDLPNESSDIRLVVDSLYIESNDEVELRKLLRLQGLWQRKGEGTREPDAQRTINAFGFRTRVGFFNADPDSGSAATPKGDEVISSYFVRVDTLKPVTVRQMSAYHGCCTQTETFRWFPKGSHKDVRSVLTHIGNDAQTLLPRRSLSSGAPAEGSFSPTVPFGLKVGTKDFSDTLLNPERKIGIRVWKAFDFNGNIIPDAFILANDYLGSDFTNYDYNDNMYFVTNIRPENGPAFHSDLLTTPSAIDFGEIVKPANTTFTLQLKNTGKTYADSTADPALTIRSVTVAGDNKGEFVASMPQKATITAGDSTTLNVLFKPVSEGLKIADLLIYYNNSRSPHRVPLYGIARDSVTTVKVHYRIKGGSDKSVTIAGKQWLPDTAYAFDNLEPYENKKVTQILATDEDDLYFLEQSSDGDKKPFRYQMPLDSGNYFVRLHFAEVYWGVPGNGLAGGAGSRVMGVTMENQTKIANLDIVQEAGVAAALVRNVPVRVTDGRLDISFTASVNRPSLSALEVYSFSRPVDTSKAPPSDTVVVSPPPPSDTTATPPPTDSTGNPPPTDTTGGPPPPPQDSVGTDPPPPPQDSVGTPPPPTDSVGTDPPPPPTDSVGTPPPPTDSVGTPPPVDSVGTNPPPTDSVGTNPPPTDSVGTDPPPPPTDSVGTNPPPTDSVGTDPPPPPTDSVVVPPPLPDTVVTPPLLVKLIFYPNPNSGRFTVIIPLTRRQEVRLRITDILGRGYKEERMVAERGNNRRDMDLSALQLKPGIYLLELFYEEKKKDIIKFIIR